MSAKHKIDHYSIRLRQSAVEEKHLKGWASLVWFFFGNRRYAPNTQEKITVEQYAIFLGLAVLSTALLVWLGMAYFFGLLMIATNGLVLLSPMKHANQSFYPGAVNLLTGLIGYTTHWHFGLALFGFHLEPYFFATYFIAGGLAVYRRLWNAIIWKVLDSIAIRYYRQQGYSLRG